MNVFVTDAIYQYNILGKQAMYCNWLMASDHKHCNSFNTEGTFCQGLFCYHQELPVTYRAVYMDPHRHRSNTFLETAPLLYCLLVAVLTSPPGRPQECQLHHLLTLPMILMIHQLCRQRENNSIEVNCSGTFRLSSCQTISFVTTYID